MKLYKIYFDGLWLGGVAIVFADDKVEAYEFLKKRWKYLEPIGECKIEELEQGKGLVYFDNGEY